MAARRSMRLRSSTLNISLFHLVEEIIARTPGICHNRECRILVGIGGEWPAVGDEKVFHIPRLAILIQDGFFWIRAHAGGADLVDNGSAGRDGLAAIELRFTQNASTHGSDDFREGFLHVRACFSSWDDH